MTLDDAIAYEVRVCWWWARLIPRLPQRAQKRLTDVICKRAQKHLLGSGRLTATPSTDQALPPAPSTSSAWRPLGDKRLVLGATGFEIELRVGEAHCFRLFTPEGREIATAAEGWLPTMKLHAERLAAERAEFTGSLDQARQLIERSARRGQ